MAAILLTGDLVFSSRVAAAGQRVGVDVQTTCSPDSLAEQASGAALVMVDLSAAGVDVDALVRRLRALAAPPRQIIAFGPHVQESLLAAARAAGCDEVLARGQFNARMDEILRRSI